MAARQVNKSKKALKICCLKGFFVAHYKKKLIKKKLLFLLSCFYANIGLFLYHKSYSDAHYHYQKD